jgi:hypothetical protein
MAQPTPEISAFLVTQVYMDFPGAPGWRMGKFVLLFDDATGELEPANIESISVSGPDGYSFDIAVGRKLSHVTLNGFIERTEPGIARLAEKRLWYMAFARSGFLNTGHYTVTVTYKDGTTRRRANDLKDALWLLDRYLASNPPLPSSASCRLEGASKVVDLRWSTLKDVADIDAYYCLRLARRGLIPSVTNDLMVFVDDILFQSEEEPEAGLNRSEACVVLADPETTDYVWFFEILDANHLEAINMAIFTPTRSFSSWGAVQGRASLA